MTMERRLNRMLLTRHTEYHIRNRECVGVRDRRSGTWLSRHPALRSLLLGGMDRQDRVFSFPPPGSRLFFSNGRQDILTSPMEETQRPEKTAVERYTWRSTAGTIELAAA